MNTLLPPAAGLALCTLLAALGTGIANVGLPRLAHDFGVAFTDVRWVVLAYLLAVTASVAGVGRLGDRLGRPRLLRAGLVTFGAGALLCGLAPTFGVLLAARVLQGVGAAALMALSVALVADTVPKARAGAAMGLVGTASAVGTALGPAVGGLLLAGPGWRALFLVLVPLAALAFLLVPTGTPAPTADRPAATLDSHLAATLGAQALVATVMMTTLVVGPFHLARAVGLGTATMGLAMSVGPLVAALAGVPSGRLVDRIGARRASRAGLWTLGTGCVLLVPGASTLAVAGYVVPLAVLTAGYALFQAANSTQAMAAAGPRRGAVSGLLNLARHLGFAAGASAMATVFALGSGVADVAVAAPGAVARGVQITFAVATGLVVVALWVAPRQPREAVA